MYGQAFRAPNFSELYATNNPAIIGNPDLGPETIRTYEVGLRYEFTESFSANVNYKAKPPAMPVRIAKAML